MNKILTNLWRERSAREQGLIGIALGLLALLLLWVFVLTPVMNYPKKQALALDQAKLDLKIMQKAKTSLQSQSGTSSAPMQILSKENFSSTLIKTAKAKGLVITRRQPKGPGEISVWMDSTTSKRFYNWVDDITAKYNVVITRAQIYANDDDSIRVTATLKLGGES